MLLAWKKRLLNKPSVTEVAVIWEAVIHMSPRHCIEITVWFLQTNVNTFQTAGQGTNSKVACHCNDVAAVTWCCLTAWFWIYSVSYVTVACYSYSQNPYQDLLNADVCKIEHQYNCCWGQYAWRHDMKILFRLLAFLRRTNRSLDSPHNGPEIRGLDVSSDVSIESLWTKSRVVSDITWRLWDVNLMG